jgi:hypothetical protein
MASAAACAPLDPMATAATAAAIDSAFSPNSIAGRAPGSTQQFDAYYVPELRPLPTWYSSFPHLQSSPHLSLR